MVRLKQISNSTKNLATSPYLPHLPPFSFSAQTEANIPTSQPNQNAVGNLAQEQSCSAGRYHDQQHPLGSIDDIRMDGQGTHGSLELHLPIDGQECEGRLSSIDRPGLVLHSKPMVAVHPGQATTFASRTDELQHFKDSLGVRPLRSIVGLDGERVSPTGDMSKKDSNWGTHRSPDSRHPPSVEANPNYHSNSELHAWNSDQANSAELVGAQHHPDARNHSTQGRPTPGGMELDDIQEGLCPRITCFGMKLVNNITDWVVNIGATRHICFSKELFLNYEEVIDEENVYLGDSGTARVAGKGRLLLKFTSGKSLALHSILHVPNMCRNLVSGFLLNKADLKIVFETNKIVLSQTGDFVGIGFCHEGSFVLETDIEENIVKLIPETNILIKRLITMDFISTLLEFNELKYGGPATRAKPEFTELEYELGSWNYDTRAILVFGKLEYCVLKIAQYSSPQNSSSGHTLLDFEKLEYQKAFFNAQNPA
ncbi:hypothetical protein SO802_022848 [Lithocarpus litseifolius]|uniref:Retrovirus-related Pol polyprotein from transposon TNT 1-94-like beta-barrel domain-containing protein n=1 Tax=Lithocarpus litseifolius TaxID=425828 RepID=A0AAW2C7Z5_9ROSI